MCSSDLVASQPLVEGGRIDESAAVKINRFVELCDSYHIPLVILVDSEGCVTSWPNPDEPDGPAIVEPGVNRYHQRVVTTHQHRRVDAVVVEIGKARGMTLHVMAGSLNARTIPLQHLAWPTKEIGHVDGYSNLRNVNAVDDVIDPAETRTRIARLLAHLPDRVAVRASETAKRHPVDT